MTHHFHLIAVGGRTDAISLYMMDLTGQYATYRNDSPQQAIPSSIHNETDC